MGMLFFSYFAGGVFNGDCMGEVSVGTQDHKKRETEKVPVWKEQYLPFGRGNCTQMQGMHLQAGPDLSFDVSHLFSLPRDLW